MSIYDCPQLAVSLSLSLTITNGHLIRTNARNPDTQTKVAEYAADECEIVKAI